MGKDREGISPGADDLSPDINLRHPNRKIDRPDTSARGDDSGYIRREPLYTQDLVKTPPEELVPIIPKDLFNYLSSFQADLCVSILLPTHPAGMEVNEHIDQKEYKNSLQQVEKILAQKNLDPVTIKKFLEPGYGLLRDFNLWHNLSPGLAVYMAEDFLKFIRLPGSVPKEILVNSTFSVSSLIPFMVRKEYFYMLVISKKQAKFYRADAFGIEYIPIDEMPIGIQDVVHFENKEDEKLFRLGSRGYKVANYHGLGGGKPDEKQNIALYLEEVDDTIWKSHLHYSNVPLLLAGVEYLVPIYRSVSHYNNIWPEALTGNQENTDSNTLYKQAMEMMKPYFEQNLLNALEEFGNKSATPLTSAKSTDIIPSAYYGRISHLFMKKDVRIWGIFREDINELNIFKEEKDGAKNLADRAAAKTIQNGGEVYILTKDKMPRGGELAAIFRYELT